MDWRITVTDHLSIRASSALNSPTRSIPAPVRSSAAAVSWASFAQDWRDSYTRFCSNYDPSSTFVSVDQHHQSSLKDLIVERGLEGLWSAEEMLDISRIWHHLTPWVDSVQGLKELDKQGTITCTLSNGNISLLQDLVTHANLHFTHLFSAETFKAYKPDRRTYVGAVEKLGLERQDCAMVAAHLGDLNAARKLGLSTVYIERKGEEAWSKAEVEKTREEGWVNVWIGMDEASEVGGVMALAEILGRTSSNVIA